VTRCAALGPYMSPCHAVRIFLARSSGLGLIHTFRGLLKFSVDFKWAF
jgi:hypothetical protein